MVTTACAQLDEPRRLRPQPLHFAQERLEEYATLWSHPDSSLFGIGFTAGDVGSAGTMAVDGMIITCWLTMGIVVGILCLIALVCAAWAGTR